MTNDTPNFNGAPTNLDPALDTESYLVPPVAAAKSRRTRKLIGGGVAVVVALSTATGVYAYQALASSGLQPEAVLPSTVVAFAKVDFDPAAAQKIAFYRLSQKLPGLAAELTGPDGGVQKELHKSDASWTYARDIKPWLGSRVAVAAIPDPSTPQGLDPILAVAYTDQAKMTAALAKAKAQGADFGYVTKRNYVLISDTQPHANLIASQAAHATLSTNATFNADVAALPGSQIADGWVNLAATEAAAQHGTRPAAALATEPRFTGRFVFGVHASASYLELSGLTRGMKPVTTPPVNGTLAGLPADTDEAIEIAGLGTELSQTWSKLPAALQSEYAPLANEVGVVLPGDLGVVFGSDTTVASRTSHAATSTSVAVTTTAPQRAKQLLDRLLASSPFGGELAISSTAHGYVFGNNAGFNSSVSNGRGGLGSSPAVREALPSQAGALALGYVNVASVLASDSGLSAKDRQDWSHLSALGLSINPAPQGVRVTVRLTTR